jgi:hypothetical protein
MLKVTVIKTMRMCNNREFWHELSKVSALQSSADFVAESSGKLNPGAIPRGCSENPSI